MTQRHDTKHPIYTSWRAMRQRCLNPKSTAWKNYGGRGVSIASEWDLYPAFHAWAMSSGWKAGLSIDRIDPNGNYEPSNCRWATPAQQASNRRPQKSVTINGRTLNVRQWSMETGIFVTTLYKRYHAGIRGSAFIAPPQNPAIARPLPAAYSITATASSATARPPPAV